MKIKILTSLLILFLLSNCAALGTSVSKRKLDVQTKTSNSVFLNLSNYQDKTIFVKYGNSTGNVELNSLGSMIEKDLVGKGYNIVHSPNSARYVLQVRALQLGKLSPSAAQASLKSGFGGSGGVGGAIAGGVAGAAAFGKGRGTLGTGLIGALVGAATEVAADSLVKDVTHSLTVDVLIVENLNKGLAKNGRENHTVRILSTANKVNLKLEDAIPQMKDGVVAAIAGIF